MIKGYTRVDCHACKRQDIRAYILKEKWYMDKDGDSYEPLRIVQLTPHKIKKFSLTECRASGRGFRQ